MLGDKLFEVVLAIGSLVAGFAIDRMILAAKRRASAKQVKTLLARELEGNIGRITELDRTLKEYPGTLSLTEIGARFAAACERESFDECRRDLPSLGEDVMKRIFAFYDQARSVPFIFSEIEKWRGNIRSMLIEDNLKHLIALAREAANAVK